MSATKTRAIELLRASGVEHVAHGYTAPDRKGPAREERPAYGREAAEALGIDPARLFKTLVAEVDDTLALAVLPVDTTLDLKAFAAVLGGRRARLADPKVAERAAGSVVGAIGPLGNRRTMPVVVDASARDHATILVSAGRRGLQIEIAPLDLFAVARAVVATIGRKV
jgi:Cys-tRNA(Pro)/Cys-tRNA(Cys) deacylase